MTGVQTCALPISQLKRAQDNFARALDELSVAKLVDAETKLAWIIHDLSGEKRKDGRCQDFCVNGLRFFLFESFFVPVKQPVAGAVGMWESRVFCEISKEMWKA